MTLSGTPASAATALAISISLGVGNTESIIGVVMGAGKKSINQVIPPSLLVIRPGRFSSEVVMVPVVICAPVEGSFYDYDIIGKCHSGK